MGFRKIFEGQNYVVYRVDSDFEIQTAVKKGKFYYDAQGVLRDKKGKRVVIVTSDFFPYQHLTGNCEGSIYISYHGWVSTAGHVAECANIFVNPDSTKSIVNWERIYMPLRLPAWLWDIIDEFGLPIYSKWDFAYGNAQGNVVDVNYAVSTPHAIYIAGTCESIQQKNCYGVAVTTPMYDNDLYRMVGKTVTLKCTLWGYDATAYAMDVGDVFVNYGGGKYAHIKPALLLYFIDKPGIPGCSGSMVYVT